MLGPKKRAMLESQMGALRETLRKRRPDSGEAEQGFRLALLILGNDALLGTLGESLCRILAANPGRRFSDIEYPSSPPEPGVSITERLASEPFEFAGIQFKAGDRFRFLFQALAYSDDPAERVRIFGFGARTCLGRALALDIWKDLTSFLSRLHTRQEVVSFAPRTGDYAFTCPERAMVRLSL